MATSSSVWLIFSNHYPEILIAMACFVIFSLLRSARSSSEGSLPWNWPILGMLPAIISNKQFNNFITARLRETGWTFIFKGPWLLDMDYIFTCDPSNINHMFIVNFDNYPKGELGKVFDIFGNNIFNADGDLWRDHRKMSQAILWDGNYRAMQATFIRDKMENALIPILASAARKQKPLDLQDVLLRFTFDTSCFSVLAADPESLSVEFPTVPFAKAADEALDAALTRHITPRLIWKLKRLLNVGSERTLATAWKVIDSYIYDKIMKLKATRKLAGKTNSYDAVSLYMDNFNIFDCGASTFQHGVAPNPNLHWGPFSRTAGAASASASSTAAAQAANVVHHTYEKVRREREEAQAAARRDEAVRSRKLDGNEHAVPKADKNTKRKRGAFDDPRMNSGGRNALNAGMHPANLNKPRVFSRKFSIKRGYPQVHVLKTLVAKSKDEIHKTVEAWHSARAAKIAEKEHAKKKQKLKECEKEKAKKVNHGNATDRDRVDEPSSDSKQAPQRDSENENADPEKETVEPMGIDVPDPDFHDFDIDRTERSFKDDEIWATYDDEDGMPRYYALIQKVLSYKPFKVRMSFLVSKSNCEFGPINWVAYGFAKTSGDFRISRYEVKDTLNMFSHRVRWEKGLRGVIKIVPRQGEVWALYRNWSPDWNEHTSDEVIYKYDMVEVLEDYSEEHEISVAPLVKIAGFKTVFHRHMDPNKVKRIPREEMFRFSHQVPSYVLTGEEGHNAPKGCYELDPAATPLELLQVVTESKSGEVMQASELLHKHSVS